MSIFFSIPLMVEIHPSSSSTITRKLPDYPTAQTLALHHDGTTVAGHVAVRPKDKSGRPVPHGGIRIILTGSIRTYSDSTREYNILTHPQELAAPGEITHPVKYPFSFRNVQKRYESYAGLNVRVIYLLQVVVSRPASSGLAFGFLGPGDLHREQEIWVQNYPDVPESELAISGPKGGGKGGKEYKPVKMDVGIEDCLHLEIEYIKRHFHLQDVVVGRVYFLLVRLRIRFMELSLVRKETLGSPPNQQSESETLVRFEIMDGQPARGESIQFRLFLGGFDLSPTINDVGGRYSVRYYLCVVLVDEDGRRYFKQSEIILYRQPLEVGARSADAGAVRAAPDEQL